MSYHIAIRHCRKREPCILLMANVAAPPRSLRCGPDGLGRCSPLWSSARQAKHGTAGAGDVGSRRAAVVRRPWPPETTLRRFSSSSDQNDNGPSSLGLMKAAEPQTRLAWNAALVEPRSLRWGWHSCRPVLLKGSPMSNPPVSADAQPSAPGSGWRSASGWVALMGGELRLDSRLGQGSRVHFRLTLPMGAHTTEPGARPPPTRSRPCSSTQAVRSVNDCNR